MTVGKLAAGFIVVTALIFGASIYYLQVYAYYREVPAGEVTLAIVPEGGVPAPLVAQDIQAIDSDSSPIRFRACFTVDPAALAGATPYPAAEPLNGPGWFSCYDAAQVGEALERGEAKAYLSAHDIADGVDRVIAVFPDGRAFAWHQLNDKYKD